MEIGSVTANVTAAGSAAYSYEGASCDPRTVVRRLERSLDRRVLVMITRFPPKCR